MRAAATTATVSHPLDPLNSREEQEAVVAFPTAYLRQGAIVRRLATWTHFPAPAWQNCLIPTTIPATLGVPPDQGAREKEMRELKRELLGEGLLLL